jgi:hypothetical protein
MTNQNKFTRGINRLGERFTSMEVKATKANAPDIGEEKVNMGRLRVSFARAGAAEREKLIKTNGLTSKQIVQLVRPLHGKRKANQ